LIIDTKVLLRRKKGDVSDDGCIVIPWIKTSQIGNATMTAAYCCSSKVIGKYGDVGDTFGAVFLFCYTNIYNIVMSDIVLLEYIVNASKF